MRSHVCHSSRIGFCKGTFVSIVRSSYWKEAAPPLLPLGRPSSKRSAVLEQPTSICLRALLAPSPDVWLAGRVERQFVQVLDELEQVERQVLEINGRVEQR